MGIERRLLQVAVAIACLVPLYGGGGAMLWGADVLRGVEPPVPPDLDSHARYLSGLLFGIGLAFLSCIPDIERKGARFRLLGAIVLVGGIGRALSLVDIGPPGPEHLFALTMELVVTPLLLLWQWRVERSSRKIGAVTFAQQAKGPPDLRPTTPDTWPAIGSDRPEDLGKTKLSSPERT